MSETPLFLPFDNEMLFAMLTSPSRDSRTLIVMCGPGGPTAATFQRNGVATRLSRHLADLGFSVLRFDYHGIGDSTGDIKKFDLEKPFLGDLKAVLTWARSAGYGPVALIGLCFGTRTALSVMDTDNDVAAIALVTMPLVDVTEVLTKRLGTTNMLKRVFQPATWKGLTNPTRRAAYSKIAWSFWRRAIGQRPDRSDGKRPTALSRLQKAVTHRVPVLMLYGLQDKHYLNAVAALETICRQMPALELDTTFHGEIHGFPTMAGQDVFVEKVSSWLSRATGTAMSEPLSMTADGGV